MQQVWPLRLQPFHLDLDAELVYAVAKQLEPMGVGLFSLFT